MSVTKTTEEIILAAARKVFARKGLEGARMQEIADEAGINKSLLHYYFRNKEKLFELIFQGVLSQFLGGLAQMMTEDIPFFMKIEGFVDRYMDFLISNPSLPGFIVTEIHRDPEAIVSFLKSRKIPVQLIENQIKKEIELGNIREVNHCHFIVNLVGLCVFPFIARPILQGILFNGKDNEYVQFLNERKEVIKETLKQSLQLK